MKKFIPIEKAGKKQQREFYAKQRNLWAVSPVTRKVESRKAYKRHQKHRKENLE